MMKFNQMITPTIQRLWDMILIRLCGYHFAVTTLVCSPLPKGHRWVTSQQSRVWNRGEWRSSEDRGEFKFSEEALKEDTDSGITDLQRTSEEIWKMMTALEPDLSFTVEIQLRRIPTLDFTLWVTERDLEVRYQMVYEFYIKQVASGHKVL